MFKPSLRLSILSAGALTCLAPSLAPAQTVLNGSFESGLAGWTTVDQIGSNGAFFAQIGTSSPVNGFAVPAPPNGARSAMTDAVAGGSHVLYQDILVPAIVSPGTLIAFSLYLDNGAETYFNPGNLDWAMTNTNGQLNLNQQARIDLMTTTADPFSTSTADILQNLFQTDGTTPSTLGYSSFQFDITAVLQAHAGQTIRLRFAEADNISFFNMGVDDVRIVPSPSSALVLCGALASVAPRRRRGSV